MKANQHAALFRHITCRHACDSDSPSSDHRSPAATTLRAPCRYATDCLPSTRCLAATCAVASHMLHGTTATDAKIRALRLGAHEAFTQHLNCLRIFEIGFLCGRTDTPPVRNGRAPSINRVLPSARAIPWPSWSSDSILATGMGQLKRRKIGHLPHIARLLILFSTSQPKRSLPIRTAAASNKVTPLATITGMAPIMQP